MAWLWDFLKGIFASIFSSTTAQGAEVTKPQTPKVAADASPVLTPKTLPTLREGDKGADVVNLQTQLRALNFFDGSPLGNFGPITKAAVMEFQRANGLVVDGVVGPKTHVALLTAKPRTTAPETLLPAWLTIARKELGVKETVGTKHNPRVIEYHSATTLGAKNDETAWCSSFANWCMKQAGVKGTGSAWARDWLKWGEELKTPRVGCIVVFERNGAGGDSHVAFFLGEKDGRITHIGGNQSNAVTITTSSKSSLLGYRWPKV